MPARDTVLIVIWAVFWIGWLGSALTAKRSRSLLVGQNIAIRLVIAALVLGWVVVSRSVGFHPRSVAIHSPVLNVIGLILVLAGLGFAVWARVHLGRNWGMPMSQRTEPELVTSGPYRLVRHPIYSGLLLAGVGTTLVTNLVGLGVVILATLFFLYSAHVEEKNMSAAFPAAYPEYRSHSKRLIPFVL